MSRSASNKTEGLENIRDVVDTVSDKLGRRLKFLTGKQRLVGHSNGTEQIAYPVQDYGMDIAYQGVYLIPEENVAAVRAETFHLISLSLLSRSHLPLPQELINR